MPTIDTKSPMLSVRQSAVRPVLSQTEGSTPTERCGAFRAEVS